jgi:hypothetical protein
MFEVWNGFIKVFEVFLGVFGLKKWLKMGYWSSKS